jgi:hypothetical protein
MESMQEVDSRKPGRLPGGKIHMDCLKVHKVTDRALGTYAGYQEPGALGGISMVSMQEVDSRKPGRLSGWKSMWTIACPQGHRIPAPWECLLGKARMELIPCRQEAPWGEIYVDCPQGHRIPAP